jgi:WD40 repeat protein
MKELPHPSPVSFISFSSKGRLASGGGDHIVHVFDTVSGKKITEFHHVRSDRSLAEVYTVSFSPCGEMMASGGADCIATIWDPTGNSKIIISLPITKRVVAKLRQNAPLTVTAFSSDGKWFGCAGGGDDGGYVKLYEIGVWRGNTTGRPFTKVAFELQSTDCATVFSFSPNSQNFVHGDVGGVRMCSDSC